MTSELQALIKQLYPSKRFKDRDDQSRPLFLANTKALATAVVEHLSQCAGIQVYFWSEDEESTRCIRIKIWCPSAEGVTRFMRLAPSEQDKVLKDQGGIYWTSLVITISNVGPFYRYGVLGYRQPHTPQIGTETLHGPAGWSGGVRPDDRFEAVSQDSAPTAFWKDIIDCAEIILHSHKKRVLSTEEDSEAVPWLDIRGSDLEEAGQTVVTVYDCFFGLS